MSYEIVKGIKIEDGKVLIKGASNNVRPRSYEWWESGYLTRILEEKGEEAAEIEILKAYTEGNFQAGTKNKYTRALEIIRSWKEYEHFDWRKIKGKEYKEEDFDALLLKALRAKLPKEKYVITKNVFDKTAYFRTRKGASFCKWYYEKEKATTFNFKEDAEFTKRYFTNSDNWEVILK